ncbi:MAG: GNAT family N-acetyltransferase [Pseudomonadota bacterium]|nr:GNAT family N-acetyltransferase [Pseudomonadota bacterium]
MTRHPLDRPAWSALTSRQHSFALGGPLAMRYAVDVAPFAAARDDDDECLAALAALVSAGESVLLLQAGDSPAPPGLATETTAKGVQMVAPTLRPSGGDCRIEPLSEADAAEMRALALLTKPGPFLARTHRLGDFIGVRENGRLVAMAGERMKLDGFAEVSGVCTHPDFRGRGYAGALSYAVAARIAARGETPFLHAYASNEGAIRLYESLGFVLRSEVTVTKFVRA